MMRHFWREVAVFVAPPLIYILMRIIWFSTRKEIHFIDTIDDNQYVWVCWHSELFMSPQAYRKLHQIQSSSAIASSHRDGTILAGVIQRLHIKPLRGSSKKGARKVLMQAIKTIREGEEVLITPDGPRGPRHSMSDGAIAIAMKGQVPVVIINYMASAFWQFDSWDKFVIPKPFSKVDFYVQKVSLEGMAKDDARNYLRKKMLTYTIT
jgi:lysophospholipid acyltransferase (LPLAT)-like uncharacterized protein